MGLDDFFDPVNMPTVHLSKAPQQHGRERDFDEYYAEMERGARSRELRALIEQREQNGPIGDVRAAERQAEFREMSDVPRLRLQFVERVGGDGGSKDTTFVLGVIEAADLPGVDLGGKADPYCVVNFRPDKMPKAIKTRVKNNTVQPVWKEFLQIRGMTSAKLRQQSLVVKVYDKDDLTRDDLLGEIEIPLTNYALDQKTDEWFILHNTPKYHLPKVVARLTVGVRFDAPQERLHLSVQGLAEQRQRAGRGRYDLLVRLMKSQTAATTPKSDEKKPQTLVEQCRIDVERAHWPHEIVYQGIAQANLHDYAIDVRLRKRRFLLFRWQVGRMMLARTCHDHKTAQHWKDAEDNPGEELRQTHELKSYPNL